MFSPRKDYGKQPLWRHFPLFVKDPRQGLGRIFPRWDIMMMMVVVVVVVVVMMMTMMMVVVVVKVVVVVMR